jgi:hypothetical protein
MSQEDQSDDLASAIGGFIDRLKAENVKLRAENARLRDALNDASKSLLCLTTAGLEEVEDELGEMSQVRGYAHSRHQAARAALAEGI